MTRYSRSVIPGRTPHSEPGWRPESKGGEPLSQDIDSLVFGRKGRAGNESVDDVDDGEADHLVGRANTDRRAKVDRRIVKSRRKAEFAQLPGEGRGVPPEGSMRGPILLAGAGVIVAVFSVVVWNAYREGVRPADSNTAPQLAAAGAFKSKPEAVANEPNRTVQASVFEQMEAPRPPIDPAPEVREDPPAPSPAAASAPPAARPAQPPVRTAASAGPAPSKPVPTQPATQPAAQSPAAVVPPAQTTEAPEQGAISLIGGSYTPVFTAGGKYVVQIAAASTEAGANAEWNKRVRSAPELFSGTAEKIVVQADVDGRTVYRVRVGAFAAAADADAFCSAIKAKGGACFRTAR